MLYAVGKLTMKLGSGALATLEKILPPFSQMHIEVEILSPLSYLNLSDRG